MKRIGLAVALLLVAVCLSGCGNEDKRLNGRWEERAWDGGSGGGDTATFIFKRGKCAMELPGMGTASFRYDTTVNSYGPSEITFNLQYMPCHGVYRFEGENNERLFFHYCVAYDDCRHIGDQANEVLDPETSWLVFVLDKTSDKSGLESAADTLAEVCDSAASLLKSAFSK